MTDVLLSDVQAAERQAERTEQWAREMLAHLEEAERQPRSQQDDDLRPLPARETITARAAQARSDAKALREQFERTEASRPVTVGDRDRIAREEAERDAAAEARKARQRAAKAHAAALKTAGAELDEHQKAVRAAWQAAGAALRGLLISVDDHNARVDVALAWARDQGLDVTDDLEHPDGHRDGVLTIGGAAHAPMNRRDVLGALLAAVEWTEGTGGRSAATSTDGRIAALPEPEPTPLAIAWRKEAERMVRLREKIAAEREAERRAVQKATGALPG